ncbi:hypothetical protein NB703_002959 [Pantoea ananatis]|uniref:Uncharacterized protein n=2 Tax=Pantoea ananas TaxID=553 RepID=A0AAJ1D111_PANAN|nr:hypothetical protein [Pantoea ananatis]
MMEQRWSRLPLPKTLLALPTRYARETQTHSRVQCPQPSLSVRQSVSPSVRQSVSPSVRQSVSPSVRQSVRNAKPHIAVLHSLPMVNIISSIIALTITPLIVMKVLLICFSSVLFILIMTRLAR